jgi:hypothetical protein
LNLARGYDATDPTITMVSTDNIRITILLNKAFPRFALPQALEKFSRYRYSGITHFELESLIGFKEVVSRI